MERALKKDQLLISSVFLLYGVQYLRMTRMRADHKAALRRQQRAAAPPGSGW